MAKSYNQQLQRIVADYRASGEAWPARTSTIAEWAIRTDRWALSPSAIISRCAQEISKAMREEYTQDAKGRRVRVKHPAPIPGDQGLLWDDMRTAPRLHMVRSFAHRRLQIVGDCRQLQVDAEAYAEMRKDEAPIQMVFDFRDDLAEIEILENRARELKIKRTRLAKLVAA